MQQVRTSCYIAVIGGGEANPAILELAREVGREVAKRGGVLLCGGLGGVMAGAGCAMVSVSSQGLAETVDQKVSNRKNLSLGKTSRRKILSNTYHPSRATAGSDRPLPTARRHFASTNDWRPS